MFPDHINTTDSDVRVPVYDCLEMHNECITVDIRKTIKSLENLRWKLCSSGVAGLQTS